jgi:ABC-type nitrate/sulfonate/bicarbonate transport system permease component
MNRAARILRDWAPATVLVLAALAAWEVAARAGWVEDYLLPAPSEVARALVEDRRLLLEDAWITGQEVLLGFGLALAAGVAIAVVLHLSAVARRAVYPLVVASQAVPVVVIAPILVIWFGFGMTPKLIVIALICFFPIAVNTLDGLRAVDPAQVKMLRTLGAGRWALLRRLELPAALPYLFSGAKVAVAVAVIGAVFGELVGSDAGLGHAIQVGMAQLLTARVFAAVVILSAMAIALFGLVTAAERRTVPWARRREAAT